LPLYFQRQEGDEKSFEISEVMVDDGSGLLHPYETKAGANYFEIKIGDKDQTVSGRQKYVISYQVAGAVFPDADGDKVYWPAINPEWRVPIRQSRVDFNFPSHIDPLQVMSKCELGQRGSGRPCYSRTKEQSGKVEGLVFMSEDVLPPGQGLFINVGLPVGVLERPSFWDHWRAYLPWAGLFAAVSVGVAAFLRAKRCRARI
jgi:hypothetical protein